MHHEDVREHWNIANSLSCTILYDNGQKIKDDHAKWIEVMEHTFVIEQRTLQTLLASMQPICTKRSTLDVTEYILFQITSRELILKATDQEISLQSSTPLVRSDIDAISFLVSGRRIFELVKELDGAIEFELSGGQLKMHAGGVDLALNIRSAEDFPPFPERIENLMHIEAPFLLSMLNKVAFLIPQNNAHAALNGTLLEFMGGEMAFVATDGHCLARVQTSKYSLPDDRKWLVPKRAIVEIKKILESTETPTVFLGTCGNQLVFSGPHFNFFTKLIAEPFPEYRPILSKEGFLPATVMKNDILKTLKRANCFLAGQFISTKFQFKPSQLDVSLENKEVGTLEESLALEAFDGEMIESRFYSPYLLNGLSVFTEKEITLFIKNMSKPIMFESEGEGYHFTYLVMPVSAMQR